MSKVTEVFRNSNQVYTDFDFSKIFIFDNNFIQATFKNTTGSEQVLVAGTLVGRVTATNELEVLKSAAADGSEIPVGILAQDITLATAATALVNVGVKGDIAKAKVILDGADTLDTMIDGRPIGDRIAGDTQGIRLVATDELTGVDNS